MVRDIRIATNMFIHPKLVKLQRRLGDRGVLSFLRLLCFVGEYRPKGNLSGMDDEDIAIASGWGDDAKEFIATLANLKLLDTKNNTYSIHDWKEHNGYVYHAPERREQAQKAAKAKWVKKNGQETEGNWDADCEDEQCSNQESAVLNGEISNAPSPTPIPTPDPSPKPEPSPDPKYSMSGKKPDSLTGHKSFVTFWHQKYKKRFGVPYKFEKAKDGKLVKELLIAFGYEKLSLMAAAFLDSKDEWVIKAGFTIGIFYRQANTIAQKLNQGEKDEKSKYDGLEQNV